MIVCKSIVVLAACFTGLMAGLVQADDCFYYKDKVFPLTISPKRIVIQLDSTKPAPVEFFARHPCLDGSASVETLHSGFAVYSLQPALAFATAVTDLLRDSVVHRVVPVYFSPPYPAELKYTDVIDVRFRAGLPVDSMLALMRSVGVHFVDSNTIVHGLWRCALDDTVRGSPVEYGNRLHALDETVWASATFSAVGTLQSPNYDPYFNNQYYLNNTGQFGGTVDVDIDADSAWMIPLHNSSLTVAVLDDGLAIHPDLPPIRIPAGADFVGDDVGLNGPRPDNDPSPGPRQSHGMACAGILCASHNSQGVMGVIGSCDLIPARVIDTTGFLPDPLRYPWPVANAIRWAAGNGARVLSCSWGFWGVPLVPIIADAIEEVVDSCQSGLAAAGGVRHGCVVVCAVGNDGEMFAPQIRFPATMPQVIAVGAVDRWGDPWIYSNQGSALDVVAPSGNTNLQGDQWTTDQVGDRGWNPNVSYGPSNWDYTSRMGGTSGACPQVAGIATLILARRTDFVGATYHDSAGNDTVPRIIRRIINSSAVDKGTPNFDTLYGYGLANAYRALLSVIRGDIDNSGQIDTLDARAMERYCFRVGPPPTFDRRVGDTDCDGDADILDFLRTVDAALAGTTIPPCFRY
jgi:subtilisin family serine protease